ncbi:MAG: CrcB protein [Halobacteriales archaeon]|jgi:CrcB protein
MNPAYLVGLGGALGAVARHAVYLALKRGADVPRGTLTVNIVGSFVLGWLTFAGIGGEAMTFLGIGACGAFTTFSSFSFETVQLLERDKRTTAILNGAMNLVGALGAIGVASVLT